MSTPTALEVALSRRCVRRAATIAAIVGTILAAVNHGDRIWGGTMDGAAWIRVGLTYLVPYTVSTVTAVLAAREQG